MVSIKLNGKDYSIPECYYELTTKQYQDIISMWDNESPVEDRDYYHLLCIMAGADYASFDRTRLNDEKVWKLVGWFLTESFQFSVAKEVTFRGKPVKSFGIGQMIKIMQLLENKIPASMASKALAIFVQPSIDGNWDYLRALEIEKEILEMPAHEACPMGFFLLARASKNGIGLSRNWHRLKVSLRQKFARTWQTWLRPTGLTASLAYR